MLLCHKPIWNILQEPGPASIALIHILCVFWLSGTCHKVNGSISIALSHFFCVLKWSGTNAKSMAHCAIPRYTFVIRDLSYPYWNNFKQRHIYSYPQGQARIKLYGLDADHFRVVFRIGLLIVTTKRKFIRCKEQWKMAIQLLKIYLELGIYQCINNEYTPKNGEFFLKKRWKHTLRQSFYH